MAFAEIESSMYKRRRTAMPSLPSSPQTSDQAESASCFASLGQSSFYRGQVTAGNNDTALVLAADGQLELLRASRLMFIDSTFHVVPRLYYQLFTVFVSHVDYTFPVVYALMTRKMTELYTANSAPSSTRVPTKSGDPRLRRRCDSCTTRSVRQRPDGVRVWFHYSQAVMKRLKKIGLSDAYQNEKTTQVVFRCLLALPLLPNIDINPAFHDVKALVQDDSLSNCVATSNANRSANLTSARHGCRCSTIRRAQTTRWNFGKFPCSSATTCNGGSP